MAKKKTKQRITGERTEQDNFAIKNEMQLMESFGYPRDQATAIAFRKFGDGELDIAAAPKLSKANNEARKGFNETRIEGSRRYDRRRRQGQRNNGVTANIFRKQINKAIGKAIPAGQATIKSQPLSAPIGINKATKSGIKRAVTAAIRRQKK
tara:strand:+ start:180 stop:635 length:456 start_codon:yes stop_codon:yes gene_type:complete